MNSFSGLLLVACDEGCLHVPWFVCTFKYVVSLLIRSSPDKKRRKASIYCGSDPRNKFLFETALCNNIIFNIGEIYQTGVIN